MRFFAFLAILAVVSSQAVSPAGVGCASQPCQNGCTCQVSWKLSKNTRIFPFLIISKSNDNFRRVAGTKTIMSVFLLPVSPSLAKTVNGARRLTAKPIRQSRSACPNKPLRSTHKVSNQLWFKAAKIRFFCATGMAIVSNLAAQWCKLQTVISIWRVPTAHRSWTLSVARSSFLKLSSSIVFLISSLCRGQLLRWRNNRI